MEQAAIEKLVNDIIDIKFNWEERGFTKPNKKTLAKSVDFIGEMVAAVDFDEHRFIDPLVYSEENGHVTIAFHNFDKALRFYVNNDKVTYRKSWVSKENSGTENGEFSFNDFLGIWEWLTK